MNVKCNVSHKTCLAKGKEKSCLYGECKGEGRAEENRVVFLLYVLRRGR